MIVPSGQISAYKAIPLGTPSRPYLLTISATVAGVGARGQLIVK